MKDASPFVFAGLWDGWQNPHTGDWLRTASSLLANQTSWYPKYTPGCLSFCRLKPMMHGFPERREKKSCDRFLLKEWPPKRSLSESINQKITILACSKRLRSSRLVG